MSFDLADFYTEEKPCKETLEEVKQGWKTLTAEDIKKIPLEDLSEHYYDVYEAIKEVITEEQMDALIERYNNEIDKDPETYPPEIFEELFEDISKEITDVDLDHNSKEQITIYKTKFDKYYAQYSKGNYDWKEFAKLMQVKPVTKTITTYEAI